jgi:ankyrin repeat protein
MVGILAALFVVAATQNNAAPVNYRDFARAIRANDLATLRSLTAVPGAMKAESSLHMQPLHYAALYGSLEAVRILLDAGADPNARNQQAATPLIYGAWDAARTKLLVERGARVEVAANGGTTALMVAASVFGNTGGVRYLLEHGADLKATDGFGDDALMRAAGMADAEATELLLLKGADAHHTDKAGFSALLMEHNFPDRSRVSLLLKAGADVNVANTFSGMVKNGPIALTHMTPLMMASPFGQSDTIAALLQAGARVNDVDVRRMSPLMLAIATDHAKPATVRQLIAAGAEVNGKDQNGESVLDWARKFKQPEILSLLQQAGAQGGSELESPRPSAHSAAGGATEALGRTLPLLANAGSQFFKEGGGCNGCHHQAMGARVYAAAADKGIPVKEDLRQLFRDALLAERPAILGGLALLQALPGDTDRLLAPLMAMVDLHMPPDEVTDAAVHYLAQRQDASGAWLLAAARPPLQGSHISRTAMAIRALTVYGWPAHQAEFDRHIERARHWLRLAEPVTVYEGADRIVGLRTAGISAAELRPDAGRLLAEQRPDGGWPQTRFLASDSYATGLVLHSLYTAGLLSPSEPAYQKGLAFLLRTQFPDGSWYVRSRAAKFQPYFQSGFPFNHDQWISSAGTAWAAIALIDAVEKRAADGRMDLSGRSTIPM